MILFALLPLICWNDNYIQLYLLAVSIDIYQVEYQVSNTEMVSHTAQLAQLLSKTNFRTGENQLDNQEWTILRSGTQVTGRRRKQIHKCIKKMSNTDPTNKIGKGGLQVLTDGK